MRYELKNSFFKRCAHIVCNFTNICHTLAYRHQQHSLFTQLSNSHIRNCVTVMKHKYESATSLPYCDAVVAYFCITNSDEIAVSNKMCAATVEYKEGHYVVLCIDEKTGLPVFGKIVGFVSVVHDESWRTVVENVHTELFVSHYRAFKVVHKQYSEFSVFQLCEIAHCQPLY